MLACMNDSAHDKDHIYRVLYVALDIASHEDMVDYDVLIAACLLHDIGRQEQFADPSLCHAKVGAEKACRFLLHHGFDGEFAKKVASCIGSHSFRANNPPKSVEANILFDADKIDAAGTIGIARVIFYKGQVNEPLYSVDRDGNVLDGSEDTEPSFFQEYKFKLEGIYTKLYTKRGYELAQQRKDAAVAFYDNMLQEVASSYRIGKRKLDDALQ